MQGCMKRILVLIVAISAIAVFAGHVFGQQNTGANPYLDSKHSYRVKIGKEANTQDWYMVNEARTINEKLTDGTSRDWVSITPAPADNDFEIISIIYNSQDAFTALTGFTVGNWFLRFEERSIEDGTCVSAREFPITISANSFWLQVSHDETDVLPLAANPGLQVFNSQNSEVNTYTDLSTNTYDTPVKYTVTMNKGAGFSPSYWQFDANFLSPVKSFTATVTTTNGGTLEQTTVTAGSDYTVKVTPPTGFNLDQVVVTISVVYTHDVLVDVTRDLIVDQGFAVQVPAVATPQPPNAITDDNITTYPLGDAGNRTQALTILAIPSTRDITFDNSINTNEDATSSKNPLQNSTHYYVVQMGDAVNNSGTWSLVNTSDNSVVDLTLYSGSINDTKNTSHALATINYGTLTVGTYTLYFSETDAARGTITRRSYPISIQPPFVIELADIGSDCADVSGELKTALEATTTNVTYTIRLKDNDPGAGENYYAKAWSFVFTVSGFNADLQVHAMTSSDASLAGAGTSRTVTVPAETHSVNVTVTYSGLYSSEHEITATASNATGVFNEKAADVSDTHTIYAMPQAGTLAGVD